MRIYFDNAATTPLCDAAIDKMSNLMREHYGNPSSPHAHGRQVKGVIELARKSIAKNLNCNSSEIYFTSGGTEADNMTLKCVVSEGIKNIITSASEHKAILKTAEYLKENGLVNVHYVKHDAKGYVDLDDLETLLETNDNCLVSLMHANNEIGNMINLDEVGQLCRAHNALFHSDTVQTVGHYPIDLSKGNIDFISASAHKFNGPKGVGFIYIRSGIPFCPMILGGGQERSMRGGTENILGIAAMAEALDYNCQNMTTNHAKIDKIKKHFIHRIEEELDNVVFIGDPNGNSNYKVLSASFPVTENSSMLLFNLDIRGISCSGGSACSSGATAPSHVLTSLGFDVTRPTIRFSFGKQNTIEEVDYTISELKKLFPAQVLANA